jgi:hypothetical protein
MRKALLLCGIASLAVAQVKDMRPVLSLELPEEVAAIKSTGASVRRIERPATEGRYALEVRFEQAKRAQIEIPVRAGDWRRYGSLALDATNTSGEPVSFSVEVRDQTGAITVGQAWWDLAPGENATYALSLNEPPPVKMGMEHEPPANDFRVLGSDHHSVDLARIAVVRISMSNVSGPRTVVFDNLRLGPGVSYEKIVDRFGQYTRRDWPGKVKSEADQKAQLAQERLALKAGPAMPERDEYGGWAAGPKLQATGYFHTIKQEGKWWLVTPSGHLFFSMGLDTVTANESNTVVQGRERMFEWLPGAGDPLAAHYHASGGSSQPHRRAFSFYEANLERKYGKDWYSSWQAMSLERLSAWGFNTIANWSDPRLYVSKKTPYVATLNICGEDSGRGRCPGMEQLAHIPPFPTGMWIYDTFDPRFPEAVDRSVRAFAAQRRNDPWLIGYFVDNELPWGFMRNDRTRYGLAIEALSLVAASPAKRAFVEQLRTRYGNIEKLNAAWNSRLASWQELLQKPYRPKGEFTAAREDMGAFVKEYASRYFRTIRDTLRKYDPNHLYLGVRFAWLVREYFSWTTAEVEEAATQYCDVISFNVYLPRVDANWDFLKRLDKPTIIGEFNISVPDRGVYPDIVVGASSQAERARMYQEFVRSIVDHPDFVGCHFWQYVDEPLTGGADGGENTGTGFVTLTDTVYPEMVVAAKSVHAEVYRRRASGSASASVSR